MSSEKKLTQPIHERTKWREDFPVDEPSYHYISRREFVKFLVLISGGFATGQLWIGLLNLMHEQQPKPPALRVANVNEVPIGGYRTFHYPDPEETCLLIRTGERTFVAYNNKCTHLMCPVVPKVEEGILHCPCHQGYFDVDDGRPFAGPPERPLARVKLRIAGNDVYAIGMIRGEA